MRSIRSLFECRPQICGPAEGWSGGGGVFFWFVERSERLVDGMIWPAWAQNSLLHPFTECVATVDIGFLCR